ncbi:MAG: hypothetical protein M3286_09220, partial [Thermoproteota archaeon]|nr:hypothetical protein [Thermoproteota archaeon]
LIDYRRAWTTTIKDYDDISIMHLLSTNEYEVKMIQKILLSPSRTFGYPLIEFAHFLSIQISAVTSQRTRIHLIIVTVAIG